MALVTGVGHILASQRGRKQWAFWLKPLPILLFLLLAATASPAVGNSYRLLICVGLALSAVGDVMLAWPRDRFVAGLASFLLAHVAYSAAFVMRSGFAATPWVVIAVALWGVLMLALLWPGVGKSLRPAVVLYVAVILFMLWQAAEVWLAIGDRSSALALVCAIFFCLSDSTLALNKFRRPFAAATVVVMTTYYLAQWLIALSVWG